MKKITLGDIFIIVFVLLVSAVLLIFASRGGDAPTQCVVEVGGREIARYSLISLTEPKTLNIENEYGKNTVVIDAEGAEVIYSDCPDKSEVKMGKITEAGQSLVCLPHRLTVKLTGNEKIDANAW